MCLKHFVGLVHQNIGRVIIHSWTCVAERPGGVDSLPLGQLVESVGDQMHRGTANCEVSIIARAFVRNLIVVSESTNVFKIVDISPNHVNSVSPLSVKYALCVESACLFDIV